MNGGKLTIMLGPMFSGKTSAILRKLSQFVEMGLNALYINHGLDTRTGEKYSTHSKLIQHGELGIPGIKVTDLNSIDLELLIEADAIAIDEAQFFENELVEFVANLVDKYDKYVLVAGLDGSYKRHKIGHVLDLIPYADNVTKLHAYCKQCSGRTKALQTALFTHYNGDSKDIINVGGAEQYEAVCRKCYLKLNNNDENLLRLTLVK